MLADSHIKLVPAEAIVCSLCVVAHKIDKSVRCCVKLVEYIYFGLLLSLQNGSSSTTRRLLMLFVGLRQIVPKT